MDVSTNDATPSLAHGRYRRPFRQFSASNSKQEPGDEHRQDTQRDPPAFMDVAVVQEPPFYGLAPLEYALNRCVSRSIACLTERVHQLAPYSEDGYRVGHGQLATNVV
jgi:hypothetical protein